MNCNTLPFRHQPIVWTAAHAANHNTSVVGGILEDAQVRFSEEQVMVIQSRMMMGIAAVIALGVAAWGSVLVLRPAHTGRVEVQQLRGAWTVEITELGAADVEIHDRAR